MAQKCKSCFFLRQSNPREKHCDADWVDFVNEEEEVMRIFADEDAFCPLYELKDRVIYYIGDAAYPTGEGQRVIAHVINDSGVWEEEFAAALNKRWNRPYETYKQSSLLGNLSLGQVQMVRVESDLAVASLCAMRGIRSFANSRPLDCEALENCLGNLRKTCKERGFQSIHMPRIASGLAGGDWVSILELVNQELCAHDIPVYIYQPRQRSQMN